MRSIARSVRAFALGLGATIVILVTGPNAPGIARPAQSSRESAFWESDVSTALRGASKSSRWVLVYFPGTESRDLSRPPEGESIARRLGERALGSHVNAADAEGLMQDYEVTRLPALVLLDSEGVLVHRWLGRWTARDVISTFRSLEKRLAQLREEVGGLLASAEAAMARGDDHGAIRFCADAAEKTRAGTGDQKRLLGIVARVRKRGESALVSILAGEGIQRDYRLLKNLEDLRKRYPLRGLRRKIDDEIERLKERKIGGRR